MSKDNIIKLIQPGNVDDQLTEILRNGARALLAQAIEAESCRLTCAAALTDHGGGNVVARGYGSDKMVRRFGFSALNAAVEKAQYPGLDLSALRWVASPAPS